jgi:hypothetical protein
MTNLNRAEQINDIKEQLAKQRSAAMSLQSPSKPSLDFSEMASKALQSTSTFFGKVMNEAKIFGEKAVERIDIALNSHASEPNTPTPTTTGIQSSKNRFHRPTLSPLFPIGHSRTPSMNGNGIVHPIGTSTLNTQDVLTPSTDLSSNERHLIEDYEVQLAMALSLSMIEQVGGESASATADKSDITSDTADKSDITSDNIGEAAQNAEEDPLKVDGLASTPVNGTEPEVQKVLEKNDEPEDLLS